MSSTRTSSPYFSPNSIMAPTLLRLVDGITRASVAALARISALTMRSTSRISSAVIGWVWAKSKRVLSGSTCEPFCCTWPPSTSRSALCIRWVAEWLRMVRARASVSTFAVTPLPTLQLPVDHAVMAEDAGLDLLRVLDGEDAVHRAQFAAVADLAAGFGVERRVVEHHDAHLAFDQFIDRRAVLVQRQHVALGSSES
jgi:hypothetical protein